MNCGIFCSNFPHIEFNMLPEFSVPCVISQQIWIRKKWNINSIVYIWLGSAQLCPVNQCAFNGPFNCEYSCECVKKKNICKDPQLALNVTCCTSCHFAVLLIFHFITLHMYLGGSIVAFGFFQVFFIWKEFFKDYV